MQDPSFGSGANSGFSEELGKTSANRYRVVPLSSDTAPICLLVTAMLTISSCPHLASQTARNHDARSAPAAEIQTAGWASAAAAPQSLARSDRHAVLTPAPVPVKVAVSRVPLSVLRPVFDGFQAFSPANLEVSVSISTIRKDLRMSSLESPKPNPAITPGNVKPDLRIASPTVDSTVHLLPSSGLHIYNLTDKDRQAVAEAAKMLSWDSIVSPELYVGEARRLSHMLPEGLLMAVRDMEIHGSALHIRNMPIGPVGLTPSDPMSTVTAHTVLARATSLLAAVCGHLVGYRGESAGRICQAIVPVRKNSAEQASTGAVDLLNHTEQAFNMKTRPDFILLSALRGDPDAATHFMTAKTIVDELPTCMVRKLSEPMFWCTVDASFVRSGVPNEPRGPFAVLAGSETDPVLTFDDDLVFTDSEPHRAALDAVRRLWMQKRSSVVLSSGETLIIDNSRVIHGRSEYYPKYDGGDRWLVRQQVLASLTTSRFARVGISPVIEMWGV